MKAFILCGGYGTRLDDEGKLKAKPMVKIGNNPILIHLIKFFCKQNIKDFVFCLGYKSNSVIDYFIKENKKKIVITSRSKNLIQFKYKSRNLKF